MLVHILSAVQSCVHIRCSVSQPGGGGGQDHVRVRPAGDGPCLWSAGGGRGPGSDQTGEVKLLTPPPSQLQPQDIEQGCCRWREGGNL